MGLQRIAAFRNFTLADRCDVVDWDERKHLGVRWAQEKRNGYRVTVFKNSGSEVRVVPRKEHLDYFDMIKQNHPELAKLLESIPRRTILDCELEAQGLQASDVPTALRNPDIKLEIYPFAVPVMMDRGTWQSYDLDDAMEWLVRRGFRTPQTLDVRAYLSCENMHRHLLEDAIRADIEGWVLKEAHYEGWYKLKPVRTVDAVVMRQTKSTSDTKWGMLKAVIVGVYEEGKLVEIANVGGGFDDEQRDALSKVDLTGRVCEVQYQSLLSKGRLQFPQFLRWREDKPADQCLMSQLRRVVKP